MAVPYVDDQDRQVGDSNDGLADKPDNDGEAPGRAADVTVQQAFLRLAETAAAGNAHRLAGSLRTAALQLGQPMRVAVAGQIKRGKSTLVNALLGEDVVDTGELENTFNVTELVYADVAEMVVRYKDGTQASLSPDEMRRLTVRDASSLEVLRAIRRVERRLPNELLRTFRLVDTPGLASVYGVDAANAAEFLGVQDPGERAKMVAALSALGRTGEDVHRDSVEELDRADAVVFLFSRSLAQSDLRVLEEFTGAHEGVVTGLKAFGVLSRCDQYWPPARDLPGAVDPATYDPIAQGGRVAERLLERPELKRMFHTLVPIAGLTAFGAQTMTSEEFATLDHLAHEVEPEVLQRRLRSSARFACAPYPELGVCPERRDRLIRRLTGWGVLRACTHLREGATADEMRTALVAESGLGQLRSVIADHFGRRSSVIKLDSALREVTSAVHTARQERRAFGDTTASAVDRVWSGLERLRLNNAAIAELSLLTRLYRDELRLGPDQLAEVRRVTGELGRDAATRLGLSADRSLAEFRAAAVAGVRRWRDAVEDPSYEDSDVSSLRAVVRVYERIVTRVRAAERLLLTEAM